MMNRKSVIDMGKPISLRAITCSLKMVSSSREKTVGRPTGFIWLAFILFFNVFLGIPYCLEAAFIANVPSFTLARASAKFSAEYRLLVPYRRTPTLGLIVLLFGKFSLPLVEIFGISQMPESDEVRLDEGGVDLRDAGGVELLDVGLSLKEDRRRSRRGVVAMTELEQPGSCKTHKQVSLF